MVDTGNNLATGTRVASTVLLYNELLIMVRDMRWGLALLFLLVIADFRFGWRESESRYTIALSNKDSVGIEKYRWHTSRAIRQTSNKFIDYLIVMLVGGTIGMALLEPLNMDHIWGCWGGACIVAISEISSITGHYLYLKGVKVEKKNIIGFIKALAIAFAKKKNEDAGEALEQAFNETEKKGKRK